MKTIYFLTTFVFFHCLNLLGQVEATEVVSGVNYSSGMAVHGNILYVSNGYAPKISKVDLTSNPPVVTDFITEEFFPNGLLVHGNDLYISEYNDNDMDDNRILKVDLTAATPEATEVVGGLANLELMAIHGNDLYVSQIGASNIVKIDLTAETPTVIEVVSVDQPAGLAVYGNELYISSNIGISSSSDKIVKIDLTAESPALTNVAFVEDPNGLAIYENELYITSDNKIVKIDLTAETPVLAEVLTTGLENSYELVVVGDILYISDFSESGKVLKLDLTTLSVADIPNELSNLGISPNPASDFLQVSGIKAMEKYAIYNVLGAKIQEGTLNDEKQIDLKKVPTGMYLLELENTKTIKFVKE
jgi:hypothetical protein